MSEFLKKDLWLVYSTYNADDHWHHLFTSEELAYRWCCCEVLFDDQGKKPRYTKTWKEYWSEILVTLENGRELEHMYEEEAMSIVVMPIKAQSRW